MNVFDKAMNYDDARAYKEQMEALFASIGWKLVLEFIEKRTQVREQELYMITPNNIETMVAFARQRGGIEELRRLPDMLQASYADAREFVFKVQKDGETDDYEDGE